MSPTPPARRYAHLWALPLLFVSAGSALRLGFPNDSEFNPAARSLFANATGTGSPGLPLTNWILGLMAWASGAAPPELAPCIQFSNIVALAVFTFGAWRMAEPSRATWLWAAALWAVNPIAVILEREISDSSLLPLPAVLCFFTWLGRRSRWAGFAWGLLGAVISQIQTTGAFFILSLAIWTFLREPRAFPWLPWVGGSLIGAAPMVPSLAHHLAAFHGPAGRVGLRPPNPSFFLRFFTQPFGFGADYTLGEKAFVDFLGWPRLGASATWLVGALYLSLVVLTLSVFYRGARAFWASGGLTLRAALLGRDSTDTLICAALWGYGGCLTLIALGAAVSHRSDMELVAPMMALWCARVVQIGSPPSGPAASRIVLSALCAIQLVISGALLADIDQRQVIPSDDAIKWRAQAPVTGPAARTTGNGGVDKKVGE